MPRGLLGVCKFPRRTCTFSLPLGKIKPRSTAIHVPRTHPAPDLHCHDRRIYIPQATAEDLAQLSAACDPATFGVAQQDVYDVTYRKAGKLDVEYFSLNFCPEREGIVPKIQENLLTWDQEGMTVGVELYKLNVYGKPYSDIGGQNDADATLAVVGKDAFFKAHKDTPRSCEMFGSLVVVLPIAHEGGGLLLKHNKHETVFDSAVELAGKPETTVAYAAFYSDVEHEVQKVVSGNRVTLTYNLYFVDGSAGEEDSMNDDSDMADLHPHLPLSTLQSASTLSGVIKQLLDNPTFLPQGGLLGFGLKHQYPVEALDKRHFEANLVGLKTRLKGADAAVARAWADCGIDIRLKLIYRMEGNIVMCDEPPSVHWEIEDLVHTLRHHKDLNLKVIGLDPHKSEYERYSDWSEDAAEQLEMINFTGYWRPAEIDVTVTWVTPWTENAMFNSPYLAYGNQASLGLLYGNVALVAVVGPSGNRNMGYKGPKKRKGAAT